MDDCPDFGGRGADGALRFYGAGRSGAQTGAAFALHLCRLEHVVGHGGGLLLLVERRRAFQNRFSDLFCVCTGACTQDCSRQYSYGNAGEGTGTRTGRKPHCDYAQPDPTAFYPQYFDHDQPALPGSNFGGLDSPTPISVRKEIEHVRHYLAIEQVRFPDMHFEFDLRSDDFILPALSIQPLVENAVKHGLMKLEKGGTIRITTYETSTVYCVEVQDTGVGFDVAALEPRTGHIGLHNIQSRLKSMCGGTLTVESTPGKGTTATITIPKEERLK